MRLVLVLTVLLVSGSASAQTSAASRDHSADLGAGIGLVALGVIGGAFTGLTFLESELRHFPAGCPGAGCPYDAPIVGYDPNLVVLGATLGALSITSILVGALLYLAPALAHDDAPPIAISISPTGAHAVLSLRW